MYVNMYVLYQRITSEATGQAVLEAVTRVRITASIASRCGANGKYKANGGYPQPCVRNAHCDDYVKGVGGILSRKIQRDLWVELANFEVVFLRTR